MQSRGDLRADVDRMLDGFIQRFYREVPYARHLKDARELDIEYYKRHNIETVLRIRKKRTCDALAIRYFTKCDPIRAKQWSHYTDDEMLHDTMFVRDLAAVGVPREEVYATEPLLSTKLLMGYLLYGLEYEEDPLALVASVYFIEYITTRTQPDWLDNIERNLGSDRVVGGRAHVATDVDENHADFVWDILITLIKRPEDADRLERHMVAVYRLWEAYFIELHALVVEKRERNPVGEVLAGAV